MPDENDRLGPGDAAPGFEMQDGHGKTWRLSDLRGQKVVLYFYPADDTPGCTLESCDFRDAHPDFRKAGYTIIGVSKQGASSKLRFAQKYDLDLPLLIDEGGAVAQAYGAQGGFRRSTFVIDEEGNIVSADYGVKAKGHVAALREKLGV